MLLHKVCGAPVEVLENDAAEPGVIMMQFHCSVCNQTVYDDQELEVIDSLALLKETSK